MAEQLRLQVYLSRNGVCSRREAMDIIKQGRVTVNGKKEVEPSFAVDAAHDKVCVDGKSIAAKQYAYVVFNKPRGYVTTKASFANQKNIYKILPDQYHALVPVGRLDKETEGLLLLTNDGDLTFALTHPKFHVEKKYYVLIKGKLTEQNKNKLEKGIMIEGGKTAPSQIADVMYSGTDTELTIIIHEGKKRQIRLMFDAVGHKVKKLRRLVQGPLQLGDLGGGRTRLVTQQEIEQLMKIKEQVKEKV